MANTIRVKRRAAGGASGAPSSLENAELAFNEQDDTLYYGKGTGGAGGSATSVIAIAGPGGFVDKTTNQTIGGTKTFSNTITGSVDGNAGTATKLATARTIAITGDLSYTSGSFDGSANVTGTGTLANSGVTAGSYTKITVDAKGRATVGATASISDLSSPTGSVAFNSQRITGLADPVGDQDAATKIYVDSVAQGLDPKQSVRVATTANIATLSGTMTVDGIALSAGDRILVKDQTAQAQNGIYVVAAGSWSRASDADTWNELVSAYVFTEQGSTQSDTGYYCNVDQGGTLGTTAVTWVQFSGAGQITAGAGLTKTGNTIDVVTASSARIVVNADSIDLATAGTAGTYRSVTTDAYGRVTAGTNPTTLAGYGITDAQPLDATLTALAGVTTSANTLIYATGSDTFTTTALTAFGRSLIDDADAAAGRTTLGLGTMATQASSSVSITGGSITNLTTFDGITIDGGTF